MSRRSVFALISIVAGLGLFASSLAVHGQSDTNKRGRKYKSPPPTARIEVTILKDINGKPIENAAVIFHPMEGEKDKGNMELKTNEDGKTVIDVLPIGDVVRLQVIAKGFQTFGDDYKIDKPDLTIEIRMKRPGEQYSIYKSHDTAAPGGASKDAAPAKDAGPADAPGSSAQPQTPAAKPQSN
jgi:5-hydroxyisourate hydrolase-like protein (transthyretin family)